MDMRNTPVPIPPSRRGAVLIVVLVCLALATALFVLVVKQAVAERRTIDRSHNTLQSLWLAEAGIERAAARLATEEDYAGETWIVSGQQLAGSDDAVVRIQVEKIADRPEQRSVRVETDYPNNPEHRCRRVKQILMDRDAIRSGLGM